MTLPVGEPAAGPWRAVPLGRLVDLLLRAAGRPAGRATVVAVDGRSASGKSTLAARLCRAVSRSTLVHTDDLAWNEPFFAWGHLLGDHVLGPVQRGERVSFRPPAWEENAREGTIDVPGEVDLVVVEGVGASQRELAPLIDATVWVQSDFAEAEQRGLARDLAQGVNGDRAQTIAFWHEWMAQELRFLQQQRPWERSCVVVAGSPTIPLTGDQVAIAPGPP
jgi:uridine kinase